MKRILALLILGVCMISCSDDEENCCTNVDIAISIKYLNENGDNLLEFENGGMNFADINVYQKVNNEWVRYSEGGSDYPKGIQIIEREDGKYLRITPSTVIDNGNYSETKLEFSESDSDIIKTKIDKSNGNTVVTKVWYNEQLKWEAYQSERKFEIVK